MLLYFGLFCLMVVLRFCVFIHLFVCLFAAHTHRTLYTWCFAFLFLNICKYLLLLFFLFFCRHFYHALYTCKLKAHNIPSCNEFCHEILFYRVKWVWYDIIIEFFRNRLIKFSQWTSAFRFEHATMCIYHLYASRTAIICIVIVAVAVAAAVATITCAFISGRIWYMQFWIDTIKWITCKY